MFLAGGLLYQKVPGQGTDGDSWRPYFLPLTEVASVQIQTLGESSVPSNDNTGHNQRHGKKLGMMTKYSGLTVNQKFSKITLRLQFKRAV